MESLKYKRSHNSVASFCGQKQINKLTNTEKQKGFHKH